MIDTPIVDFLEEYANSGTERLHMPGHKGKLTISGIDLGRFDVTEISGADDLYHPTGIIKKSEQNVSKLFGCRTFYSTEGASQCIKTMLFLALQRYKRVTSFSNEKPFIAAAGNVHKSFIHAAALLDVDVEWIQTEKSDNTDEINGIISPQDLERRLSMLPKAPMAVYLTYPDYLGGCCNLREISKICHEREIPLLTDGAHSAYFYGLDSERFPKYQAPFLYSDMCVSSAHKTLPVLTGGAYLHCPEHTLMSDFEPSAIKAAMSLFGSSSPSYLILASLDNCNKYMSSDFKEELSDCVEKIRGVKESLMKNGWKVLESDPLRISVISAGSGLPERLRRAGFEYEMSDENFTVLMFTPSNGDIFELLTETFGICDAADVSIKPKRRYIDYTGASTSIRDAVFSPMTSPEFLNPPCPPAIPH